ncbi:MAG: Hydrogenobyrinate a,c-diamide synthase [Hyphomicrobiaceae bacterium hypho_1]
MAKRTLGLIIAAPSSGIGKTVLTLGLVAALRRRGYVVAVAKAGPDYIDPQFLSAAAGFSCINLDSWAMSACELRTRVVKHASEADILIIEGAMGLFDGPNDGVGSTADLAEILALPVILAVDASRQAQSIAAIVHGFTTFRMNPKICGVITTKVASDRHADMVFKSLLELNICNLGAFRLDKALKLQSRHLGLVQAHEFYTLEEIVKTAGINAETHLNLDRLVALAGPIASEKPWKTAEQVIPPLGQHIAVAHDSAFSFTYPHILSDWRAQGAQISLFSPLKNEAASTEADAIFLPGGYPELYAGKLSDSNVFLDSIRQAAKRDTLIYGECGGYMVLGQSLIDSTGKAYRMSGLLSHVTSFYNPKLNIGYRTLKNAGYAWQLPKCFLGHEFHYSYLTNVGSDLPLFYASDSSGCSLGDFGGYRNNVMGSYAHVISTNH